MASDLDQPNAVAAPLGTAELSQILRQFLAGQPLSPIQSQQLESALSRLWQVGDPQSERVDRYLQQLQQLYPGLDAYCQLNLGWPCRLDLLWQLWLPLAEQIVRWREAVPDQALILGIVGLQGTGKTTLTLILAEILQCWGLRVCSLSIDDFYKPYTERQQLQQSDPRFRWRGPPGTHDLELALSVLQALHRLQPDSHSPSPPIALPRFDKSAQQGAGDRSQPDWVTEIDLLLFEGWFLGLRPIESGCFETAPPPIQTAADREFAQEVNRRLADYLPLWAELDRLILLYPSDYRLSQQWRQQAEQQMMASGKPGMAAAEIKAFVEYFWRALHPALFLPPLMKSGDLDLVIQVNSARDPIAVYQPAMRANRA